MSSLLTRLANRRFRHVHKKTVRKWYADGGETALRLDYGLGSDSVVLDLGGYEGQWAHDLFSRHQCRIHVFEPVSSFIAQIEQRFRENDKVCVYPYGLGGSSREETIHLSADGSSCFGASELTEAIRIVDVQEWLNEHHPGRISLMKINIEGGEYELLERMIETGSCSAVDNFQIQFHNIGTDSRTRMEKIQEELSKTHHLTYQYDFVWENWERNES